MRCHSVSTQQSVLFEFGTLLLHEPLDYFQIIKDFIIMRIGNAWKRYLHDKSSSGAGCWESNSQLRRVMIPSTRFNQLRYWGSETYIDQFKPKPNTSSEYERTGSILDDHCFFSQVGSYKYKTTGSFIPVSFIDDLTITFALKKHQKISHLMSGKDIMTNKKQKPLCVMYSCM